MTAPEVWRAHNIELIGSLKFNCPDLFRNEAFLVWLTNLAF